jgi:opacity protein-like surface antigen
MCLLFLAPGLAFAADDDPAGYLGLKLGYFIPNGDNEGLNGFNKVFAIGVAGGVKMAPWIAIELGGDYYKTKGNDTKSLLGFSYSADAKVTTWSIPLTLKLILPVSKIVQPFVGGGAGWYFTKVEVDGTGSFLNVDYSPDAWSYSKSANNIGYHAVAGLDINITPNFALGAEVKWCVAKLEFKDLSTLEFKNITNDKINIGGTTINFVVKGMF